MTALILALLAQVPVRLERANAHCYVADDQSAGWKQAALPTDTPALAAPPDVDQFRSGEPVLVLSGQEVFAHGRSRPKWGVASLAFAVHPDTRLLHVRFGERLDGMRVEVLGSDGLGRMIPLQPERRYSGEELKLEWNAAGVRQVTLLLHHHLRAPPVVTEWSAGHFEAMPSAPARRLTYLHPGGRNLQLCEAPNQRLRVRATVLTGVTR